jgi:hypothetical protein
VVLTEVNHVLQGRYQHRKEITNTFVKEKAKGVHLCCGGQIRIHGRSWDKDGSLSQTECGCTFFEFCVLLVLISPVRLCYLITA